MGYVAGLIVSLIAFWLTMSGQITVLHLSLGAVSIVLTLIAAYRLDILDAEASPYGRVFAFLSLLALAVVGSGETNCQVVRSCLSADLDIISGAGQSALLIAQRSRARHFRQFDHADAGHGDGGHRRRQDARACAA